VQLQTDTNACSSMSTLCRKNHDFQPQMRSADEKGKQAVQY